MTDQRTRKVQAAPGNWCCDDFGRIAMLARASMSIEQLARLAMARGEGTFDEVANRIDHMIACGVLIEI